MADSQLPARLFSASIRGNLEDLQACLAAGVSPNSRDQSSWTPLMRAADGGHSACVAALLADGADPTALSSWSWSALHAAARCGSVQCVAQCLAAGGSPLAADKGLWTPLHVAAFEGHVAVMRQLFAAAPAAALAQDAEGRTPLGTALDASQITAALRLLSEGPLQPASLLLAMLRRRGDAALPLYAAVAARQPLTAGEWELVPSPCPGLAAALPAVLARSPEEAAQLVRRLAPAERQRLQLAALSLARAQRAHGVQLPGPVVWSVLVQAAAPA